MGYSPILGRFLQRDPSAYVEGQNLYLLELSNPLSYVDPEGTASQSTTQPTNNAAALAAQQLAQLNALGTKFAQTDPRWSWQNQCDVQAADLQASLLFNPTWQNTSPKLWDIGTTGGTGQLRFLRHNVVLLTPINGNPLPPQVLDSFHGPQHPLTGRQCTCETQQQFKKDYPDPIGADPWYDKFLDSIAGVYDDK